MRFAKFIEQEEKMVATNNVPVHLYHGTPHYPFDKMAYRPHYPQHGFYFTDRPDHAGRYSMYNGGDDGGYVIRVKVNIKKLKRVTKEEVQDLVTEKDVARAKAEGYDGMVVWDEKQNRAYEYIVFDPENIQIVDFKFVGKNKGLQPTDSFNDATPHGQKTKFLPGVAHFAKWIMDWEVNYNDNPHDYIPDFENMEKHLAFMGPKTQAAFVRFMSHLRSILPRYQDRFNSKFLGNSQTQKGLEDFDMKDRNSVEAYLDKLKAALKEELG